MRITFKTAGILQKYLPAGAKGLSAPLDVADGATAVDVMSQLGLPMADRYLVALNGTVLATAERPNRRLAEGDELAIMPPLKGG
ncbi:MAG: MoaD/ThiS family protein [Alphaproteobacteria bacterium]|nr:MoaD/ThiS family protein [Alphaproteobacteria bacterium]